MSNWEKKQIETFSHIPYIYLYDFIYSSLLFIYMTFNAEHNCTTFELPTLMHDVILGNMCYFLSDLTEKIDTILTSL